MARPGFVLTVDERTPPLVVPSGDGFRLERFPLGTEVVYPADSSPPLPDLTEATNAALDAPLNSRAAGRAAAARNQAHHRLRRHHHPGAADAPTRRPGHGDRDRAQPGRAGRRRRRGPDRRQRAATGGMTPAELQRLLGERVFRSFFADGLLRNHDAEDDDELAALGTTDSGEVSINARVAASDLVIFVHVVADPRHTTGREAARRDRVRVDDHRGATSVGGCGGPSCRSIASAVPIFQIDVVLDNDVFPAGLAFLSKREWEWSIREQVAWRGIRRGLSVAPARLRRPVINRSQATFSPTAVFAGDPAAVTAASRERISDDLRVSVPHQVDVGVLGVGQHTPYSVDAPVNPILAAWQGLVGLLGAHTGRSLVRDGGAVIIYHPMPNDFSPLHHPSYVDFYADVLTRTADPERDPRRRRTEVRAATRGTPICTGPARPFTASTRCCSGTRSQAAKQNYGDVVFVGADRGVDRSARLPRRLDPGRCPGDRLLRRGALAADRLPARAAADPGGRFVTGATRPARLWLRTRSSAAPARDHAAQPADPGRPRRRRAAPTGPNRR